MQRKRIKLDLLVHDLKGPLAVIETGLAVLLKKPDQYGALTESQRRILDRLTRNAAIARMLVHDMLEVERSAAAGAQRHALILRDLVVETLTEMFELLHAAGPEALPAESSLEGLKQRLQPHGVLLIIDEDLWQRTFNLDGRKISQILRNLLLNAFRYRKQTVTVEFVAAADMLICSVADDGRGIPAQFHEAIFKSYFQLDTQDGFPVRGHGLGLAGSLVLAEDMGGALLLESDAGAGARFILKLPLEEPAGTAEKQKRTDSQDA